MYVVVYKVEEVAQLFVRRRLGQAETLAQHVVEARLPLAVTAIGLTR